MTRPPKRQREGSTVTVRRRRPTDALAAKRQTVQVERKPEIDALTRVSAPFMGTKVSYLHVRAYTAFGDAVREQQNGRPHLTGNAFWLHVAKRARMSVEECRILIAELEDFMKVQALYDPIT